MHNEYNQNKLYFVTYFCGSVHGQRPHQFHDYTSLLCVSQMVIKHVCNVYVVVV